MNNSNLKDDIKNTKCEEIENIFLEIEQLERDINKSFKIPFTDLVLMNSDELYEFLENLRDEMPKEYGNAIKINSMAAELISAAESKADKIIKNAREVADKLVDEDAIVKEAQKKADRIVKSAFEYKKNAEIQVQKFASDALSETEGGIYELASNINSILEQVKEVRLSINSTGKGVTDSQNNQKRATA